MKLTRKYVGPESKYDSSLPYTYEARVPIVEGDDVFNYYFADTICGLIDYLDTNNISPDQASLFEIYQDKESPINARLCTTQTSAWMHRPQTCESFREHYKGHIEEGKCSFRDRDRTGCGP